MPFRIVAYTPKGLVFDLEATEAYFDTTSGPMGVFGDYAPGYFTLKKAGVLRVLSKGNDVFYAVFGGVVQIKDNVVTVLSGEIEDGVSIDLAKAIASRDKAKDRLAKNVQEDVEAAKNELAVALAKIDAKNHSMGKKK